MAYADMWNELIGFVPSLSPFLSQDFINRAWRDIRQTRRWSFLLAEGVWVVPPVINSGTISVTQYSKTVTPDATAIAALNGAGTHPPLGERQFRLSPGTRIYNIDTWDGATLTLKEEFQEASVNNIGYQVHRCYFKPPSSDFISFLSIRDLITNYHIRLNYTQAEINLTDPQRNVQGDPLYCLTYKADTDGTPLFELWPTPTNIRSYQCLYQRRGTELANASDVLPAGIPEHLVLARALYYAYRWAETTKGNDKRLQGPDWRFLMAEANKDYAQELQRAVREDEDVFLQQLRFNESRSGFLTPIDANYAQNHVVDWM